MQHRWRDRAPSAAAAAGGDTSKGTVKIAIELPLQGSEKAASEPIINGIRLAVKDAGGAVGGYTITVPDSAVYDDALNGAHDPQTGANNMTKIVADPDVIAVIGPLNSSVAKAQIPISNAAGLLQCSPANTNPDLTKGAPAAQLRTKPNNYIRVVTTDDVQGPAASQYIYDMLKKKSVYIIDDTETFGKGVADAFEEDFKARGGTVVKHDAAPKTTQDYVSIMTAAKALNPESIYFGGVTATGGARILLAAQQVGLGDIPYVGPDGINDGSGATKDSFLNLAARRRQELVQHPGRPRHLRRARTHSTPTTRRSTASTRPATPARAMPAPRSSSTRIKRAARDQPGRQGRPQGGRPRRRHRHRPPSTTRSSATITFDANGDTSQKIVSIYSFDPAGAERQGRLEVRDPGRLRGQVTDHDRRGRGSHGSPASPYPAPRCGPRTLRSADVTAIASPGRRTEPARSRRSRHASGDRPRRRSSRLPRSSCWIAARLARAGLTARRTAPSRSGPPADRQRALDRRDLRPRSPSATRWSTGSSS